jgi:integrase
VARTRLKQEWPQALRLFSARYGERPLGKRGEHRKGSIDASSWVVTEKVTLKNYADQWLNHRFDLAIRTRELYEYLLNNHIYPVVGNSRIENLTPPIVRGWYAELAQRHRSTAAKSYRLLSTIMTTAVTDGIIVSSPCRVRGAGSEHADERPVATVAEVRALAEAMPDRLRLVVLLVTWCQLRRGEILGLRRRDVDPTHSMIHIEQSRTIARNGTSITKPPKSRAGWRSLAVSAPVMEAIVEHLESFTDSEPDSLLFCSPNGPPLSVGVLQRAWTKARLKVGRPDLHLHDLRHTGLTFAAATGATTAELMRRAGHASTEAALRYQHATQDRDRILAKALEDLMQVGHCYAIVMA